MAFGVTATGFVIKPLEAIRQEIDDSQRANIDPGLDLDDRSVLGQINAGMAIQLSELWEVDQAVYAAMYPDSASGDSLDSVSSITGTTRDLTTKTIVRDVDVTLSPNKSLPEGSVAHLTGQPNSRFVSLAEVPSTAIGGEFQVDFQAENAGDTAVVAGQLDQIAEPVDGWTEVDNQLAGETGDATETDSELRTKRVNELQATGSTNVDAIRAGVLKADGVTDAIVFENDTHLTDALGRPPHSIHVIVRGGTPASIADAIFVEKAGGIFSFGSQSLVVKDSQGTDHTIRWDNATELVFHADMTVVTDPLVFDVTNGPQAIKDAVAAYINALDIGDTVIYDTVKAAVLPVAAGCGVPGVKSFSALTIWFNGDAPGVIDLPVEFNEFASSDTANIAVTVI